MKLAFLAVGILLSQLGFAQFKEPTKDGMIIAEWDLAFPDQESLDDYYGAPANKLIVNRKGLNSLDIWDTTKRKNLSFCISDTFKDKKKDVIEAMKVATQDWMDSANVKFIYKKDQDSKCDSNNTNVLFDIRPVSFGQYLARSFFPSYERKNRNLLIDSSSFGYSFVALSGFLRHELGHLLGFRHEHISNSGNHQCDEDDNFIPLTPYDQSSVMHYPQCGGKNNIQDMILSPLDKEGLRKAYPFN